MLKFSNKNVNVTAYLDIKVRLLINKYILTIKKCEDILNEKDEIQKLHSIMFADSLIMVGDIIYDVYIKSLKSKDKTLRNKSVELIKKEIDRINSFMKIIYCNYNTLTQEELKMIIKEYK
jgi:hypothetical protein